MAQNVATSGGICARFGAPVFVQFGQSRRRSAFQAAFGVFFAPLPADAIGTASLTLNNVVVGSRILIMDQAGTTTRYNALAAASTVVIPLDAYSPGSALNDWRIRVRKASSAQKYLPYETLMTASVGSSSIFISQIPDTIAS